MAGYGYVSPYNRNTTNDPFRHLNQSVGDGQAGQIGNRLEGFDPRDIMEGDAYKQLMAMGANGSGAYNTAMGIAQPGIDYYNQALGSDSPLGTGRGDIVRNRGFGAVSSQLDQMGRQVQQASTAYGRAADPEAAAFSQGLVRNRAAGQYGLVEGQAQEVALNEKQMNESFKAGIAQSLSNLGLGMGGLQDQEARTKVSATGQALQAESFARNTAAELLTRIMGYGAGSRPSSANLSLEDRGMMRQMQREAAFGQMPNEFGQMNPFGAFGNFGGVYSDRTQAGRPTGGYPSWMQNALGGLEGKDMSQWTKRDHALLDYLNQNYG